MQGLGNNTALKPRIKDVQLVVCADKGLHLSAMTTPKRLRKVAYPRQVAMALAREMCGKSYPQLGRAFGGRDHTTVLFAYRKIARAAQENPDLEIKMNRYRERIAEIVAARAGGQAA